MSCSVKCDEEKTQLGKLLLLLFTEIEFSLGGSSPYNSNKNRHKRNNTKPQ